MYDEQQSKLNLPDHRLAIIVRSCFCLQGNYYIKKILIVPSLFAPESRCYTASQFSYIIISLQLKTHCVLDAFADPGIPVEPCPTQTTTKIWQSFELRVPRPLVAFLRLLERVANTIVQKAEQQTLGSGLGNTRTTRTVTARTFSHNITDLLYNITRAKRFLFMK